MAKKPKKESGLPVLIALVFFVLLSVGLGVFCYVLYSDQEGKAAEVAKANKEAAAAAKLLKVETNKAKVYRIAIGIEEGEDRASLIGEAKPGDENVAELKKINDALDKRLASVAPADKSVPPLNARSVLGWAPDAENKLPAAPTLFLADAVTKAVADRELAKKNADTQVQQYAATVADLEKKSKDYDAAIANLGATTQAIAKDIKDKLTYLQTQADKRANSYVESVNSFKAAVDNHQTDISRAKTTITQQGEKIANLQSDLAAREELKKKNEQFYDQPLGKVLRRLPDNTVEIDIGSNDKAKAGLTFAVLPADFPVKGYQSRVKVSRVPDDRGQFRDVARFVEKANLEIIEVLGPNSSKARFVSETNDIRDRVLVGDLLYNAAWRRGYVDHVALYGIFDTNGDGSDDIKTIVRDFEKMGIPVDAYFDLKERKWVGTLTSKTRYLIKGHLPNVRGATDPFIQEKTTLIGALNEARTGAVNKGITEVSFRDLFPRMGYRVNLDVTDDKINQATSQYIQGVGAAPTAPAPGN